MVYVALLRGVNVGGKNRVEMSRLKDVFERVGHGDVRTYINSGNVVFTAGPASVSRLASDLEESIASEFGLAVPVLIKDMTAMTEVEEAIPPTWVSDASMRCDVMFLWEEYARPGIVDELPIREGIDNVIYAAGAVIWQVDAKDINRSGRGKIIGGQLYRSSTVRNANTVRKLTALMRETGG